MYGQKEKRPEDPRVYIKSPDLERVKECQAVYFDFCALSIFFTIKGFFVRANNQQHQKWIMETSAFNGLIIAICITILALIFCLLRIYARVGMLKFFGSDDAFILVALVCTLSFTIGFGFMNLVGAGRSSVVLGVAKTIAIKQLFFGVVFGYVIGLVATKISVLLLYFRLAIEESHRRILKYLLAFNVLYSIVTFVTFLATCRPVATFWDEDLPGGTCRHNRVAWYLIAGCDIVSNLTLVLFPIALLRSLTLPKHQKYSTMFILAMAGCGFVVSCLRFHSFRFAAESKDFVRDVVEAMVWSSAELNVGVICASLPVLRPLSKLISDHLPESLKCIRRKENENPRVVAYKFSEGRIMVEESFSITTSQDKALERPSKSENSGV